MMRALAQLLRAGGHPDQGITRVATGVGRAGIAEGVIAPATLARLIRAAVTADTLAPRQGGLTSRPWVIITQGSRNPATPGEAHDGGGAVDLRSRHLTIRERRVLINALINEGFGVHDLSATDAPHFHLLAPWESGLTSAAKHQFRTSLHKPT